MRCPFCDHLETQVSDTRTLQEAHIIRRRRVCLACKRRFTTYERAELQLPRIIKKNGIRVPYDRAKLQFSLDLALRKRAVPTETVNNCIARIEEKLLRLGVREIPSEKIGDEVMRELKKLDKVAYIRFASVYRRFEDIKDFSDTVKEIRPQKK